MEKESQHEEKKKKKTNMEFVDIYFIPLLQKNNA